MKKRQQSESSAKTLGPPAGPFLNRDDASIARIPTTTQSSLAPNCFDPFD